MTEETLEHKPVNFAVRSASGLLDIFLALSVSIVLGALSMWAFNSITGIEKVEPSSLTARAFNVWMLILAFLFYAWFWLHGQQTLGLKLFGLKIAPINEQKLTWSWAVKRFVLTLLSIIPFFIGYLTQLWDENRLTVYDKWTQSTVIYKNKK